MTNFNERTNTLLYKNISLTLYSRKGWCWLCVRGELETGIDCYIDPAVLLTHHVYYDLPHWKSNQRPQNAEPKALPLSYWPSRLTNDIELTSHNKCACNQKNDLKKVLSVSLPMRLWYRGCISPILLGRRSLGDRCVLCKSTNATTRPMRLISRAFIMTSLFRTVCVWWGPVAQSFCSALCGRWFHLQRGYHGINCWWNLIMSKQLSSGAVCYVQNMLDFLVMVNQIHRSIGVWTRLLQGWNPLN